MAIGVTKNHRLIVADSLDVLFPVGGSITNLSTLEWNEVSSTPDKGSEPEMIDAPAINLTQARQIAGAQGAADDVSYEVNLDIVSESTLLKVLTAMSSDTSKWFYEEYTEGTDTTLGNGHLYRGKPSSVNLAGQSFNELESFTAPVTPDSKEMYIVMFTESTAKFYSQSTGKDYTLTELKAHEGITTV